MHSTSHLSDSAVSTNPGYYAFTPQDKVLLQIEFKERKLNCFGKFVVQLRQHDSKTARIAKLIFFLFLTVSLVGMPLIYVLSKESDRLDSDEQSKRMAIYDLKISKKKWNKNREIVDKLGIANFDQIPIISFSKKASPHNLSFIDPIVKGIDPDQGPFLFIKLKDRNNEVFLLYLTQNCDEWLQASLTEDGNEFTEHIDPFQVDESALINIRTMIEKTHEYYVLAN